MDISEDSLLKYSIKSLDECLMPENVMLTVL